MECLDTKIIVRHLTRDIALYLSYHFLSFVDCLCVAHAERLGNIDVMSFDKGFDRIHSDTGVSRIEP